MNSELLDVSLENFEGPLDLLIHLIYKNELNIYDIPIAFITERFIAAVKKMEQLDIEVAAEFINMASYLVYLKSRMLLPRDTFFEEELDPEEEKYMFTQRLVEYSFYRDVTDFMRAKEAESSKALMRSDSIFITKEEADTEDPYRLACAFFELVTAERKTKMVVEKNIVDFKEVVARIKELVFHRYSLFWSDVTKVCKSRKEVAVSLLAVLELVRLKVIMAVQEDTFGDILIEKTEDADGQG
jgi:segregation and condensation protein A